MDRERKEGPVARGITTTEKPSLTISQVTSCIAKITMNSAYDAPYRPYVCETAAQQAAPIFADLPMVWMPHTEFIRICAMQD